MNLSVKDVAALLNVSDKTIYRMIKEETIPCFRVGGQWRFDRREIDSWVEDTRQFSSGTGGQPSSHDEESISVAKFLRKGGVHYRIAAETREQALRSCIETIRKSSAQFDTGRLFDAIMDREKLCPTAIGNGIAFPHPRRPIKEFASSGSLIALCFLERPLPFGALDREDVDTLFFIFPRNERRFLRIQAKLLRLLKDDAMLAAVRSKAPADELYRLFEQKEEELLGDTAA
ncbi:MAG: PTS sugar transporter subunit IIA [Thermodesulfovibrionales bacterium]